MSLPKTFKESSLSTPKGAEVKSVKDTQAKPIARLQSAVVPTTATTAAKKQASSTFITIQARGGLVFQMRAFEIKDIDALYFLMHRCCNPKLMPSFEQLLHLLLQPNSAALVSQLSKGDSFGLAGGVLVCWNKDLALMELCWCGTHDHFRRRGLGKGMIKVVQNLAVRQNLKELVKGVESENEIGKSFLESLGFNNSNQVHPVLWGKANGSAWRLKLAELQTNPTKRKPLDTQTSKGKT